MIQVAPQAVAGTNTTAFHLDLCNNTIAGQNKNTFVTVDGHITNRLNHDVCYTTVMGANWANEKNFIVIQNAAGSAYAKRNIE